MAVEELRGSRAEGTVRRLAELLCDAVAGNASVGFRAGLTIEVASSWWRSLLPEVESGRMVLFAWVEEERVLGTVQLQFASMPNGRHRAEVAKLLVDSTVRRRGIGSGLMEAAERRALELGRTLLILDTESGSAAERLYERRSWVRYGMVPDFAYRPDGALRPSTFFYKQLAPTR